MTKYELVAAIAGETGLTMRDSAAALESAMHLIKAAVARGEKVTLVGFGVFEVEAYPAHGGGGPWTGRRPVFRPGVPFRKAVET